MSIPRFPTIIKPPYASLSPPSNAYHDVFISCRRNDIETLRPDLYISFVSELVRELSRSNFQVTGTLINDDSEVLFGHYSPNTVQLDAIKRSRCLVIVLTKGYVKSITCLRELSKIMEEYRSWEDCKEVIPVFYQDPTILVKELQDFGKLLECYIEGKKETFFKWKSFKILSRTNRGSTDLPKELSKYNLDYAFSEEDNQKLLMEIPTWKSALERISTSPNTILVDDYR
ncbi:TMV resistance protein N-like [Cucumis melo var. makuwa]|uniref:ADP-ribosyl cyclase/cyclic ADP-ribose hydrolase n=1 Tax=Cucumis melo var. makuwa TaxID=1194695 RepID=A0A5A7T750_CUCMM|nr:TMV resistance protein N-like [Cucumis melo var. makuwa]TYK00487.1 TMV resistance protein N-like [Cucumis melo var. makuwa]